MAQPFFGGRVCGSWLALGGVALVGLAAEGARRARRGSGAVDLGAIVAGVVGGPPPGWTRGTVYGQLKRLLRENKKLQVRSMRIGTGRNFEIGLYGPHADLVARTLESGGLRLPDGKSVILVRTLLSGDGSNDFNPITLDYP